MKTQHEPEKKRFVAQDDKNQTVGYLEYEPAGENRVRSTHTVVSRRAQGKGIGKLLMNALVEWARQESITIDPECPFVRELWERFPEKYGDVVVPE